MINTYAVNEMMGNFSAVVATFDNETEAQDYILEKCQTQAEYNAQGVGEELDNSYEEELELAMSYFNIEVVETDLYTPIMNSDNDGTIGS